MKSHGHTKDGRMSPTYATWNNMIQRCKVTTTNPSNQRYYVAKGITVCERWLKFENFLEDMGVKPFVEASIDRKDPSKGYEPSNCHWATASEQVSNLTPRTLCKRGHPLEGDNIYWIRTGDQVKRRCRTCKNALNKAYLREHYGKRVYAE